MAQIIDVTASPRADSGSAASRRLRKAGIIPGVIYGRGQENVNVQLDGRSFTRTIMQSNSENILVNLIVGGSTQLALVQDVQHDHLRDKILHVDFHAVKENEEIHASVPVETVGTPEGAKFGGLLELVIHNLQVYCLPKHLPDKIVAEVSHLGVGQAVHVRDLALPEGVRVKLDGDVVVAVVSEPKVEEAAPAAAAAPAADAKAAPAKGAAAPAADAKAAPAKK